MGLVDLFEGKVKTKLIEIGQAAHQEAFPARELGEESRVLFHGLEHLEHHKARFKKAISTHLSEEVAKDQKKAGKDLKKMIEAIDHSLKDEVVLAHIVIEAITDFIKADERIRAEGFPKAEALKLEEQSKSELADIKKRLWAYGNALRQLATE